MNPLQWPKLRLLERRLQHLSLSPMANSIEADDRRGVHGRVVWATAEDDARVGVAWDWSEIQPGVLVITNPLEVQSNLEVESEEGQLFPYLAYVRALNTLVHALPWQAALNRDVEAWKADAIDPKRRRQ